jgi:hypothetical protein
MKVIKTTYLLFTCVFLAWLLFSYFEIICKNLSPAPVYSSNNLLIILFKNLDAFLQGGIF